MVTLFCIVERKKTAALGRRGAKGIIMKPVLRRIEKISEPQPVIEGAGVKLKRSVGTRTLDYLDPFLLLDHFASTERRDYEAGFPLHPHRGIETVTYFFPASCTIKTPSATPEVSVPAMFDGWLPGRGIMHEEMPQVRPEGVAGFQLWVNLPANLK